MRIPILVSWIILTISGLIYTTLNFAVPLVIIVSCNIVTSLKVASIGRARKAQLGYRRSTAQYQPHFLSSESGAIALVKASQESTFHLPTLKRQRSSETSPVDCGTTLSLEGNSENLTSAQLDVNSVNIYRGRIALKLISMHFLDKSMNPQKPVNIFVQFPVN